MSDLIDRQAAIDALNEYFARIGKLKRRGLTKGEKAISLDTVEAIKNLSPVEAIPVSWIEAKIELVNDLPGVSMLKMKAADWVDLIKQWRAEQRNPEVDHDAQIRELAEEMQKHGVHKPSAAPSTAQTTETTAPSTDDWIPVERELPVPKGHVPYLITEAHYNPEYKGRYVAIDWYDARDPECPPSWDDHGARDGVRVTAWRPLPEPYRGGDK